MMVSGGNGGLHGPLIARELGDSQGDHAGIARAWFGARHADDRHPARLRAAPKPLRWRTLDFAAIRNVSMSSGRAACALLEEEGVAPDAARDAAALDVRYVGQEY